MSTTEEFPKYQFDPHRLPPRVLAALGLIAGCAAQTENTIEWGIAACTGLDMEIGAAITTHMNMPQRDNVLRAVAEIAIDDLDHLDELDALLDEVNESFKSRNEYLHHNLFIHPATGEVLILKTSARGSLNSTYHTVTAEEIEQAAERIYVAGLRLFAFFGKVGLQLKPPPSDRIRTHKSKTARNKRKRV